MLLTLAVMGYVIVSVFMALATGKQASSENGSRAFVVGSAIFTFFFWPVIVVVATWRML